MRRTLSKIETMGYRFLIAAVDMCLSFLALTIAYWLRYDDRTYAYTLEHYVSEHTIGTLLFLSFYLTVLSGFRMYRRSWRFAGMEAAYSLLYASLIGLMGMVAAEYCIYGEVPPRGVVIYYWLLSTLMIGGLRIFLRITLRKIQTNAISRRNPKEGEDVTLVRAVIVGCVEHGAAILKAIAHTHSLRHYEILGFLDDRTEKTGMFYGGVKVLGTTSLLVTLLDQQAVDEVIFAQSEDADGAEIRGLVLECRKRRVLAKIVPNFAEQIVRPNYVRLEDIRVEDLLRRPSRSIDIHSFGGYLTGKRVLITGAGGSIGSEICRQVMKLDPEEMILLGHGENSIFRILQELKRANPGMTDRIYPVIASITNNQRIDRIFRKFKPQVVFHAAAHKHLPLMEDNVCEAVHNNIIGTSNIVKACVAHDVERMVQISTDKAADPSCVMGATKWICETIVRSAAEKFDNTTFVCVRFGNVLGSRGSVIPVFHEQIKNGGPVTVTHPEMTRFFMTIPEAVRLVLQTGSVGHSGDVYLLDMGKPVKILDLAEDMIRLNGCEPGVDIPITFTGIRPGEKMHECLASVTEKVQRSNCEGLNIVTGEVMMSYEEVMRIVERFSALATEMDGGGIIELFTDLIPGYGTTNGDTCITKVSVVESR